MAKAQGKRKSKSMKKSVSASLATNETTTTAESTNRRLTPEIRDEVLRLYNAARDEHGKNRHAANMESPAHVAAVAFADEHGIPGIRLMLEAIVLNRNGKCDEARRFLDGILELVPQDLVGQAHHVRGFVFYAMELVDEAIAEYQMAIATPGYDSVARTLNNLANSYRKKNDDDRAIEYYEKALATPGHERSHVTAVNLGNALREKGRFQEALEHLNRVLDDEDLEEQHLRAASIKRLVEADLAGIAPNPNDMALMSNDSERTDRDSPEARMTEKLQRLEDKYQEYLLKSSSNRDDTFSVLRGWSSAVTLLEGTEDVRWCGGGYFLKWQGKGIVIDPGFDFLDNFHDAGFHARQLDAVLVSHNHSDHNMDLQSVDDLRYQIYWRSTTQDASGNQIPSLSKCQIVLDEDTARAFIDQTVPHRDSPLRFTKADFQRGRWHVPDHLNLPITVEHFPVEHGPDVPGAVGLRLRLHVESDRSFVIGYTGDTEFFDGLAEQLRGCDILIAHISQPDNREFTNPDHKKEKHLGYNGVTRLIQELDPKPKLILIGEFWAGLADLRIELIQGLRNRTGLTNILPTGLGFHVRIPSLEVECTECKRPTSHDQLKIVPPTSPFGPLGFLCPRCMV